MVNGLNKGEIHDIIRVLSEPGTATVMLTQARPPLADCNGREKGAAGEKAADSEESEMSRLRRVNAEQANTIVQLRMTQDPAK